MIITVVIPCYNVSRHIAEVIKNLPAEVTWVVAVNDSSKDNTGAILNEIQKENKKLIVIHHEKKPGCWRIDADRF